jgi:protein involved in polysaccharide export with SLBB domain
LKFVWLFIVLFLSQVLWAQRGDQASELKETTRSPVFDIDLNQFEKTNEQLVPQQQFLEQVFETEIDSTQYIMGPGDQLLIKIWGVLDTQFITAVTPEGYVIIPSVSEVFVSGKTLAAASKLIKEEMDKVFKNAGFSVRLVRIRKFRMFVVGEIRNPGAYYLRSVDRIGDALQLAGGLVGWGDETRIQIRHESGIVDTVNISEFYVSGDLKHNPLLTGGDVVFVPPIDLQKRYVILEGNVGSQGLYQVRPDENLFSLLTRLKTINRKSDIENIVIIRDSEKKVFNLLQNEAAAREEILQNGDRIMIPTIRDRVYVKGEVLQPGSFPYLANYTAKDYAGLAGMLASAKDFNKVYVIHAETGQVEKGGNAIVDNGDIVVVPRNTRENVKDILAIITPVISIALSTVAIIQASK